MIEHCHVIQEATLELISPENGAVFDKSGSDSISISLRVSTGFDMLHVKRQGNSLVLMQNDTYSCGMLIVRLDGVDILDDHVSTVHCAGSSVNIRYLYWWFTGIHTISACIIYSLPNESFFTDSLLGQEVVAHFMVADVFLNEVPGEFDCAVEFAVLDHERQGHVKLSEHDVWRRHKQCLHVFTDMFPTCWQAQYLYGKIFDALGQWKEAAARYRFAADANVNQVVNSSFFKEKAAIMQAFDESERNRKIQSCRWIQSNISDASIMDDVEDLYLSIIMVSRHDSTEFCQRPVDACLDRLQTSLSVLLRQLALYEIAADTEIIFVDWNPCYLNKTKQGGSCSPQAGGYLSLEEFVSSRVEVPSEAAALRFLVVNEELHESFYNPLKFDLLEYVGKNIAARRARGRFILFTNPDDCFSDAMVAFLARKKLRTNAFYNTFRSDTPSFVRGVYFPANHLPSADAMARHVFQNGVPHPGCSQTCQFRRAGCRPDSDDEQPMLSDVYNYSSLLEGATGDFFLISKEALYEIRAYPEIPSNCFIDGTLIYAAVAHGYGQLVLTGECTIYHQSHPRSFNTGDSLLDEEGFRMPAHELLVEGVFANYRADDEESPPDSRPMYQWNDALWGLASASIPQVTLAKSCSGR